MKERFLRLKKGERSRAEGFRNDSVFSRTRPRSSVTQARSKREFGRGKTKSKARSDHRETRRR